MTSLPRKIDDVTLTKAGDESILYNARNGKVHILNGVGVAIWELLDGSRTYEDVVIVLEKEYEADPQTVRDDIESFIKELGDLGLLRN